MINIRKLRSDEIQEAQKVFQNSIDYSSVHIAAYTDDGLIYRGGAMTYVYQVKPANNWIYVIWWRPKIYTEGVIFEGESRTFIHELTHVWQGQHGTYPTDYWYGAAKNQGLEGLKDIVEKKGFTTWDDHRGRAYSYSMNNIGVNNWNDFNYEQQASLIEDWYASTDKFNFLQEVIPGGKMSKTDPRYPFITLNILPGSINAQFIALKPLGQGADEKIKAIQDILVQLRYLDPKYANGYTSKQFRDAVTGYQKNNGLYPDGKIGGPNSETRKKLGIR